MCVPREVRRGSIAPDLVTLHYSRFDVHLVTDELQDQVEEVHRDNIFYILSSSCC